MQCHSPFDIYNVFQQPQPSRRYSQIPFALFEDPWESGYLREQELARRQQEARRLHELQRIQEIERQQEFLKRQELQRRQALRAQQQRNDHACYITQADLLRQQGKARNVFQSQQKAPTNLKKSSTAKIVLPNKQSPASASTTPIQKVPSPQQSSRRRQRHPHHSETFFPFDDFFGLRYASEESDEERDVSMRDSVPQQHASSTVENSGETSSELSASKIINQPFDHTQFGVEDEASETEAESDSSETETEQNVEQSALLEVQQTETLNTISKNSARNIETFDRILNSFTHLMAAGPIETTALSSWIKVLEKSQMTLEKLYEQLDLLDIHRMSDDNRTFKRKLTKQTVQYADKVENLVVELKAHLKANLNEEKSDSHQHESPASQPNQKKQFEDVPKRKVMIEDVEDESLSE